MASSDEDPFWFDRPSILLADHAFREVIPVADMTRNERLNALMRASIYGSLLLTVLSGSGRWLAVALIVAVVTFLVHTYMVPAEAFASSLSGLESDEPRGKCTEPTGANPFMNVLAHEYGDTPGRAPACSIRNASVASKMKATFDAAIVRDPDDVYHRVQHSDRQFYTMPNTTIPNDQDAFAKWLVAGSTGKSTTKAGSQ